MGYRWLHSVCTWLHAVNTFLGSHSLKRHGYYGANYRQTSNIERTLIGNKIVDYSNVIGASRVWRCYNCILILDLTPGFNGKDNCKMRWETFKFWDWVRLVSEVWLYIVTSGTGGYHNASPDIPVAYIVCQQNNLLCRMWRQSWH